MNNKNIEVRPSLLTPVNTIPGRKLNYQQIYNSIYCAIMLSVLTVVSESKFIYKVTNIDNRRNLHICFIIYLIKVCLRIQWKLLFPVEYRKTPWERWGDFLPKHTDNNIFSQKLFQYMHFL